MLSSFPRDVLDEMWDLIGSVSEGFPTYSSVIYKILKREKDNCDPVVIVNTSK